MTKNRVEAFSDGVFAIVITLLVLELRPPVVDGSESLASALWDQWPAYVAYLVSFVVIGVMWLNHHRLFDQVRLVDGPLLLLNLNLLLWTALIPFPTVVVADYLRAGSDDAKTAVAFYSAILLLNAISWACLYIWITRDDRILGELPSRAIVRASRLRFTAGVVAYAVALGLAFISPYVSLAFHAVLAGYYAFDQASLPATAS